jgi:hypothetical protein
LRSADRSQLVRRRDVVAGALAAGWLVAGIAVLAAPAPAHAVKRSFFGVQGWSPPSADEFVKLGRDGVGTVRLELSWSQAEPEQGQRKWGYADDMVARATLGNVDILPVLVGSPAWAAPHHSWPPMTREGRRGYVKFVREIVERFGRRGDFWRENPHLRYDPIKSWQVWNEPNFPAWWDEDRPNAKEYVSLLRGAARAIRKADPKARVVLAGLAESRNGIPTTKFLKQIYRIRGARRHFDVVALHPYAYGTRGVVGAIERARRTMRRNGDRRTRLMITETGWATGGGVHPETGSFKTSLKGQARRLRTLYRILLKNRRRYRLDGVVWFSLQDRAPREGEPDWWGFHTGLHFVDGRPKPAWDVFTTFVGKHT